MELMVKDDLWCFACGRDNPHGLHLQGIHLEGLECVAAFVADRHHQGWAGIVHGGITATLLDELMTHAIVRRGYDAVTAEMTIRYRKKVPTGETLTVRAGITSLRGKLAHGEAQLLNSEGDVLAEGSGKFLVTRREADELGGLLTLAGRSHIIFDLFGTLVPVFDRNEYLQTLVAMAAELGMEPDPFSATFRAEAQRRVTGHWATLEDGLADIARRAQHPVSDEALARAAAIRVEYTRCSLMNPYPDALATLAALRDAGRTIGLISDCSPETPLLWQQSPLAEYIPHPIFSTTAGLRKPDPAIYRMALQANGLEWNQALYVGDGDSTELPGAKQVGLFPVLIDRGEASAFRVAPAREAEAVVHDLTELLLLLGIE